MLIQSLCMLNNLTIFQHCGVNEAENADIRSTVLRSLYDVNVIPCDVFRASTVDPQPSLVLSEDEA